MLQVQIQITAEYVYLQRLLKPSTALEISKPHKEPSTPLEISKPHKEAVANIFLF